MTADVTVRLLEGLVAVAETGTFTAAALRVHVSQPALSQSIRRLEAIVGTRLIDRHSYGATLTPAGESLAEDARTLLTGIDGAVARAVRAGDDSSPPEIVVGFGTTTPREVTNRILDIDESRLGSRIRVQHVPWGQERARLIGGDLDVVLLANGGSVDGEYTTIEVGSYPRLAVVPAVHRLAGRNCIGIGELDREPIIDAGSDRDYWLALPRPSGAIPPIVSPAARTVEEMLAFVSAGRGIAITSASVAESSSSMATRFVLIHDLAPVTLDLARLRDDRRPRILRLFDAVAASSPRPRDLPGEAVDSRT